MAGNRIDAFIESCFKTLQRFEQQRAGKEPACEMDRETSACGSTNGLKFCTVCELWLCEHCQNTYDCSEGRREHTYRK